MSTEAAGVEPARGRRSRERWHDLTRIFDASVERVPGFPAPTIRRVRSLPHESANVTEVQLVCHVGTHVDAPRHFFEAGDSMDQIALSRLVGEGVVWEIATAPFGEIIPSQLEKARPELRPGDMVLLSTGWSDRWGTPSYLENPALTEDAAQWLVAKGATLIGVDFATPDLAHARRPEGFSWPVHHILLGANVLIAEHLTNVAVLAGKRVELVFGALPIRGADGAPARVIGRALEDGAPHG